MTTRCAHREPEEPAGLVERRAAVARVDHDADHPDGPGTVDALRGVVEEHDVLRRRHRARRRRAGSACGSGFGQPISAASMNVSSAANSGRPANHSRPSDRVGVVGQHPDRHPGRAGVVHQRRPRRERRSSPGPRRRGRGTARRSRRARPVGRPRPSSPTCRRRGRSDARGSRRTGRVLVAPAARTAAMTSRMT